MENNLFLPIVYIDPMLKQAVDMFIDKVFMYYNGRINPNNKLLMINKMWHTQLELRFANNDFVTCDGEYGGPIINIYPTELLVDCASYLNSNDKVSIDNLEYMNQVYCSIITTIVHELYHAEQAIENSNCIITVPTMEFQVYIQTIKYLKYNQEEIKNIFGVIVTDDIINNNYYSMSGYLEPSTPEYRETYTHISTDRDKLFCFVYQILIRAHSLTNDDINKIFAFINSVPDINLVFVIPISYGVIDEIKVKVNNVYINRDELNYLTLKYYTEYLINGFGFDVLTNTKTNQDLLIIKLACNSRKEMISNLIPVDQDSYAYYSNLISRF